MHPIDKILVLAITTRLRCPAISELAEFGAIELAPSAKPGAYEILISRT
jgi:hypothetical protein